MWYTSLFWNRVQRVAFSNALHSRCVVRFEQTKLAVDLFIHSFIGSLLHRRAWYFVFYLMFFVPWCRYIACRREASTGCVTYDVSIEASNRRKPGVGERTMVGVGMVIGPLEFMRLLDCWFLISWLFLFFCFLERLTDCLLWIEFGTHPAWFWWRPSLFLVFASFHSSLAWLGCLSLSVPIAVTLYYKRGSVRIRRLLVFAPGSHGKHPRFEIWNGRLLKKISCLFVMSQFNGGFSGRATINTRILLL